MIRKCIAIVITIGLLSVSSCKTDSAARDGAGNRLVSCAADSVRRSWPTAYPHVQHCLTGIMDSPLACLDALPSAIGVAIETVACIVRDAGRAAAAQQGENPDDVVTVRKAERARAWLDARGFMFQ
jgi:hypothetical protein